MSELNNIRIRTNETIDTFIDRFQTSVLKCRQYPCSFEEYAIGAFIQSCSNRYPQIKNNWQSIYASLEHKTIDALEQSVSNIQVDGDPIIKTIANQKHDKFYKHNKRKYNNDQDSTNASKSNITNK